MCSSDLLVGAGFFGIVFLSVGRYQVRDEILRVSAADVRAAGAVLADLPASRSICVFGPSEAIDASTLGLQAYDLMGMQSASSG